MTHGHGTWPFMNLRAMVEHLCRMVGLDPDREYPTEALDSAEGHDFTPETSDVIKCAAEKLSAQRQFDAMQRRWLKHDSRYKRLAHKDDSDK